MLPEGDLPTLEVAIELMQAAAEKTAAEPLPSQMPQIIQDAFSAADAAIARMQALNADMHVAPVTAAILVSRGEMPSAPTGHEELVKHIEDAMESVERTSCRSCSARLGARGQACAEACSS